MIPVEVLQDCVRLACHAPSYNNPYPTSQTCLALIDFALTTYVTEAQRRRVEAIRNRHTGRTPFGAPANWSKFERTMRAATDGRLAYVDVIGDGDRSDIEEAIALAGRLQPVQPTRNGRNGWWTTPSDRDCSNNKTSVGRDQAALVVISAVDDTRRALLCCGESLSQVLIEATMAGLATAITTDVVQIAMTRRPLSDVLHFAE